MLTCVRALLQSSWQTHPDATGRGSLLDLVAKSSMPCRAMVLADRISTLLEKRARLAAEAEALQDPPLSEQQDEDDEDAGLGPALESLPSEPDLSPLPKPVAPARYGSRRCTAL